MQYKIHSENLDLMLQQGEFKVRAFLPRDRDEGTAVLIFLSIF